MKKYAFIIFVIGYFCSISLSKGQDAYYYFGESKISLFRDSNSVVLFFKEEFAYKNKDSTFSNPTIIKKVVPKDDWENNQMTILSTSTPINNISAFLGTMGILETELDGYSYGHKTIEGTGIWPSMNVVFRLKQETELDSIKNILLQYNASFVSEEYGVYTYKIPNINNVFNLSNTLFENGYTQWSEPDFAMDVVYLTDDPYYPEQFFLNNTGQIIDGVAGTFDIDIDAPEAWNITLGSPDIKVAVIDDGVEDHEDLKDGNGNSRVLNGYTPNCLFECDGRPKYGCLHGQAFAGIIAASHNTIGVSGIAPNVKIIPINLCNAKTASHFATAIGKAWEFGADVISCSFRIQSSNMVVDAINIARSMGRGGKGCLFIAAAGNNNGGPVNFPANVPGVIAVGAIDLNGNLFYYSNIGPEISLVAPSGDKNDENDNPRGNIRTIDREGKPGYNSGDYHTKFGGTSASCPMVAGVAALLLSVDPSLTEAEVYCRLTISAIDMGPAGRDDGFGYGRVNAYYAIALNNMSIINKTFGGVQKFTASNTITIGPSCVFANTGPWLSNIQVVAGEKIVALPGSRSVYGSQFHAHISQNGPCGTGPFKSNSFIDYTTPFESGDLLDNNIKNTKNSKLYIYPNPNNGNMSVVYEIKENETGIFEIYNLVGAKLLSYPLYGGKNKFDISATSLEPGVYFYSAIAGSKQIGADKIVIIK